MPAGQTPGRIQVRAARCRARCRCTGRPPRGPRGDRCAHLRRAAGWLGASPRPSTLPSRASTATHDAPGELRTGRLHQCPAIRSAGGAGHGELRAAIERRLAVLERAHPAASPRAPRRRWRRQSCRDGCPSVRLRAAAEGGVQVDDVDARGAGGRRRPRATSQGRSVVDVRAVAAPWFEADGLAAQGDSIAENQHGATRSLAALAHSARVRLLKTIATPRLRRGATSPGGDEAAQQREPSRLTLPAGEDVFAATPRKSRRRARLDSATSSARAGLRRIAVHEVEEGIRTAAPDCAGRRPPPDGRRRRPADVRDFSPG